jgi:hypothetical protein
MRRVSAVNGHLEFLGSKATEQGTRGPRFLRTLLTWLGRRVPHLTALPMVLGGLPPVLRQFMVL